jgi:ribosomal-protein-alanine N-acetyltransferase
MNQEISAALLAKVRKALVADIPAIMTIASTAAMASQWSEAQYLNLFAPGPPERQTLVIEQDSNIAGFLVARCSREEYEIENIVISMTLQHQGLGAKLLKEFIRIASKTHPIKVLLEVRKSNVAARAFYAKFGFTPIGERKNYYQNPEESALLYQLVTI